MDITVVTTASNDDEGRALLKHLGFPFNDNPKPAKAKAKGPAWAARKN